VARAPLLVVSMACADAVLGERLGQRTTWTAWLSTRCVAPG